MMKRTIGLLLLFFLAAAVFVSNASSHDLPRFLIIITNIQGHSGGSGTAFAADGFELSFATEDTGRWLDFVDGRLEYVGWVPRRLGLYFLADGIMDDLWTMEEMTPADRDAVINGLVRIFDRDNPDGRHLWVIVHNDDELEAAMANAANNPFIEMYYAYYNSIVDRLLDPDASGTGLIARFRSAGYHAIILDGVEYVLDSREAAEALRDAMEDEYAGELAKGNTVTFIVVRENGTQQQIFLRVG